MHCGGLRDDADQTWRGLPFAAELLSAAVSTVDGTARVLWPAVASPWANARRLIQQAAPRERHDADEVIAENPPERESAKAHRPAE